MANPLSSVEVVDGNSTDNGLFQPKLTDWDNEPAVRDLKTDLENARSAHQSQMAKLRKWSDLLKVEGTERPVKRKNRSSVQPKLIRRQAEWRYAALTEPFLSSEKMFNVTPVTFEDSEAAKQNELLLNWQFRTKLNSVKFIDDYVRSVVDEGTCIVQTGWERKTVPFQEEVPEFQHIRITEQEDLDLLSQAISAKQANPREYEETAPPEVKAAVDYFEETQEATVARQIGTKTITTQKVILNHPTAVIMDPNNVLIDPSCEGDLNKAMFVIVSFETSQAELKKAGKRYKNLESIDWEGNTPLTQPDHVSRTPDDFQFRDAMRKRVVAYEYWGFYDVNNTGELTPIVCTWIGNVMIRMEENPFPDKKLPFVAVPYMPVKRELYGEPDAEMLEDQQRILGAVTRGMIDLMGRSANAQKGYPKQWLDAVNKRRFENGQDYEYNPSVHPQQGIAEHKYPEIPRSALEMINLQNQEAEALTGVKSFSGGMSGETYGDVAAGIKGVLDAAAKREMAILRRLAKGMKEIGNKFIAMNGEFLSEKEVVRVTNSEFITVKRDELVGDFDLKVDISTAEIDNMKAQDLGFMLQTMGPSMPPEFSQMILGDIADLKRMPELAQRIRTYKPEPDPHVQQMQQLELMEKQKEIEKLDSEIALNLAKAQEAQAKKDLTNLDYVEQETGTKHARDMEKQRGQAEGNQDLEVTKAMLKNRKPDESAPDIESAVGYNALTRELSDKSIRENPVDPYPVL